jgi:predicted nuclease with RNAse H fold
MSLRGQTVVGIDVGGKTKGFHAVALHDGVFETLTSAEPDEIVGWCLKQNITIIAVDAPCGWSQSGASRLAERELAGKRIHCFSTPTRTLADEKSFYDWVFNGEKLYQRLFSHYPLFNGERGKLPVCFETFPHAVVCALSGRVVPSRRKAFTRRKVLQAWGCDDRPLSNIDFVDAALCAVAAEEFRHGRMRLFGGRDEGFIVVPALCQ